MPFILQPWLSPTGFHVFHWLPGMSRSRRTLITCSRPWRLWSSRPSATTWITSQWPVGRLQWIVCLAHCFFLFAFSCEWIRSCGEVLPCCCFQPLTCSRFVSSALCFSVGCVLGLALVLTAHCSDQHQHGHFNVTQSVDKMLRSLQESSGQGRLLQEVQTTLF